jgi:hypothetical protein
MLERELQSAVIQTAGILGYLAMHTRPAWTGRGYRTPIQGNAGFPDLVLVGHGKVLFRELKVGKGVLTSEQAHWLNALREAGADACVWTDEMWVDGEIEAELKRGWGLAAARGAA